MNKVFLFLLCLVVFACADSSQQQTKVATTTVTSAKATTISIVPNSIDATVLDINFTP
ncbi:hypothetical protein KAOT1_10131, partial [Kordia algicida OT-1]